MVEVKADELEQSFEAIEQAQQEDEVEALRDDVDALKAKVAGSVQRPALETVKPDPASGFVDDYLRHGATGGIELKAVESSTNPLGGYAVPKDIDELISETLLAISPIRAIANVVRVGSSGYRKLIADGGTPSGWVAYEAARPETATPNFTEIVPASGELYANPAATQQMLDDAMFDVEAWLANEIATEFARAEGSAFVNGTGVNQPLGFLKSPVATTADGTRAMGTLQTIGTGSAGGFPASNPADKLIDLVQALRSPYRQGAVS